MTAIFISHRSSDDAEAQVLKDWLGQQGHEQLFLDFDPADGIPAGVDWEQRLYQELRRCQALMIVLTPAWLASKWCGNELAIAREKGKAVFVVRVKPCPGGPLIPALQEVDLTVDRDTALEKLARGLKEHGLDPRDAFDWKPDRPIYPGLAAFDVDDAAIFFGRSEESWQIVEALRRMRLQATGSPKLLLITGASGSGKSSLMRAGVLARLRKEPACWLAARPFRRGADALAALAEALTWAFPPARHPTSLEAVGGRLAGPEGAAQLLTLARELRLALDRPDATLVLALDQAEELLAAERADDAAKLLDLFRATLAAVGNEVLVIATIRSDRLGAWQQHASIKATADHGELAFEMLPLGPMPMARIGEIVRGPAAYEGLQIDDDLVDAIRADTSTPDALPLLAYTLQYLHRQFASDGRLTLAEYRSLDGLEGSVRSKADAAIPIEQLSEDDRRALRDAFVPGLVRAMAEGGFSRGRAVLATLPRRAEPYLRRLIDDARLLTTDRDAEGNETLEITHESLLRVWPTLARWLAADAQELRRLEAIQRAAQEWAHAGHREDFLVHRDHRLADAEALIAEQRFASQLDNAERDYLVACRNTQNRRETEEREAQERELRTAQQLAAEQRAKNRRTRIGVAAIGLLVLISVFSIQIFRLWSVAEGQKSEIGMARQGMLAAIAQRESERGNLDAALALALEANNSSSSSAPVTFFASTVESVARFLGIKVPAADSTAPRNPIASEALRAALSGYHEKQLLSEQSAAIVAAALSENGRRILSVAADGGTLVTDAASGQQLFKLEQSFSPMYVGALNADGSLVAVASFPKQVSVWSVDDQRELFTLDASSATHLRFEEKSKLLSISTLHGSVLLFPVDGMQDHAKYFKHTNGILSIDLSDNANKVGIGSIDGSALIWVPSGGGQISLRGHSAAVRQVRFSPDGARVATASSDRTAIIWDSATGEQIAQLRGHEDWVTDVVFSPDGGEVLTASVDRTVRLWEIGTARERCRFSGHRERIAGVSFVDDGTVVTASFDGTLRLWNTTRCILQQTIQLGTSAITALLRHPESPDAYISNAEGETWRWSIASPTVNKQSDEAELIRVAREINRIPLSCASRNALLAETNVCDQQISVEEPFRDDRQFVESLYFVLRWEGGYADHPGDPGGAVNKGVTQKVYDDWRTRRGLSARDVKEIEDWEVVQVYFDGYWVPPRCGLLPPSLGMLLFDTSVNMGPRRSTRLMQAELGFDVDGELGPQVWAAVAEGGQANLAARYVDRRDADYRRLAEQKPTLAVFLKGWLNRLNALATSIGVKNSDATSASADSSSRP